MIEHVFSHVDETPFLPPIPPWDEVKKTLPSLAKTAPFFVRPTIPIGRDAWQNRMATPTCINILVTLYGP
jgi:hypothetical protein